MRPDADKIALFRRFFLGRTDVYGTYDPESGRASQVKQPVTDAVLLAHFHGRRPYGVYLLVADRVRAAAVDFDREDLNPPIEFVAAAKRYGIPAYIERSKSKGYHVWVFMEEGGVLARKARLVLRHVLDDINLPRTEIFPKQDCLHDKSSYGNFINAPLFGRLVPQGRTLFLSPSDPTSPCKDPWDFLEQVSTVAEQQLDEIIEINDLARRYLGPAEDSTPCTSPSGSFFALPACARRMLSEGVTEFQRVACFRLAVHLKKTGLPGDLVATILQAWAARNKPTDGKAIITAAEVADQVRWAYHYDYRSCGCEETAVARYCSPDCPIRAGAHKQNSASFSPPYSPKPVRPMPKTLS